MLLHEAAEATVLHGSGRKRAATHEATASEAMFAKTAPTLLRIGSRTRIRASTTTDQPTRIRIRTMENRVRELIRQVSKLAHAQSGTREMKLDKIALVALLCSTLV